jgi:DNA-binding transcriptional LysR family regulator
MPRRPAGGGSGDGGNLSLAQLRVFWTVANSVSLTKAAKQLGLSQPSLSQQIARLERALGGRLFDRINNQLVLTDAGRFLVRKAEIILAEVDEVQAGLFEVAAGRRRRIAVGALASIARCLVPAAVARTQASFPALEVDLHELSPVEAIDQLYGRNLQLALLSAHSIAANRLSFSRIELLVEPYALAVPRGLGLAGVTDPERELPRDALAVLNRCIQFNFGNQHTQRVEDWYRRHLPRHGIVARCRTYEVALAMVEAGLGVALVPSMTAQLNGRALFEVDLFELTDFERPIVALVPPQYRRVEPFTSFIAALQAAASDLPILPLSPMPPFLRLEGNAVQRPSEPAPLPA